MMYAHVLSVIVLLGLTANVELASISGQKVSKEKMKEAAMILINDCKTKVGASDDDLQTLKKHKMPLTPEGLCMTECFFNTVKIMKDGKLCKEGAIEVFEPALRGDQTKIDKMKAMVDLCAKEIGDGDANSCNTAKMIVECTTKHGKEFGFTFPNPF